MCNLMEQNESDDGHILQGESKWTGRVKMNKPRGGGGGNADNIFCPMGSRSRIQDMRVPKKTMKKIVAFHG